MSVPINVTKKPTPSSSSTPAKPTYFSNGRALSGPPLTVRIKTFLSIAYCFIGLYLTTLFTLDSTAAAAQSPFAVQNRPRHQAKSGFPKPGFFGGGGGGGGGGNGRGPGGGGSGGTGGAGGGASGGGSRAGSGGKRLGRVDDVRGPECGSCQ
ncbi:Hypothetical protein D9617_27g045170 [Elsinoe fawcettii]|nr:Hypothetical protein D9617_27g045170 [Elsinoe fawcettii]